MTGGWREAEPRPFWLDSPLRPAPAEPLADDRSCALAVVGGGFTGLWAALQAKEDDPDREVVLLEQGAIADGATGRNGGFADASLTHGLPNGIERFPDEITALERLGRENLAEIERATDRHGIDCSWERPGYITVARAAHEVDDMRDFVPVMREHGLDAEWLDADRMRSEIASPTYVGGLLQRTEAALVDPARLAWGLRRACIELGVSVHEGTPVASMHELADGVLLSVPEGRLRAERVVLATNGFPPLVGAIRRYVAPVYDYVLVTEPLDAAQKGSIGWNGRQGLADAGNQFHYYRLTDDDRILWGGYDAIYHYGNAVAPELEQRPATFELLAGQFFETFPQLEGLSFTHRWGGVIDTCSRFCVMFDTALGGRVSYAVGYTGLGVAASRFGARVALDLVDGRDSEATRLRFVRSKPLPFPPEPLRFAGIRLTIRELARADRNGGRRSLYLRALDRLGVGFDS
ncbi:MAG TPA: FAD-dependent oxidoreductase [Gaiellales bacterium]|nr:FAD-dependent oxidoreductase [Gaiellales bacterium]